MSSDGGGDAVRAGDSLTVFNAASGTIRSTGAGRALSVAGAGAYLNLTNRGAIVAAGEDGGAAVAVRGDASGLVAIDNAAAARIEARDALDKIVSDWACRVNADEAALALQADGVAAHVSWSAEDIAADTHLRARRAIVQVRETDGAERAAIGFPTRFSKSDAPAIERGTPKLGEHEEYVFGELLGLSSADYARLVEDQAIY